jgi:Flp pilus assembly protein TadG
MLSAGATARGPPAMRAAAHRLTAACRRIAADHGGVVAAITALLIVPLALAVGVAVDASRMFLVRSRLSQAVDAAALAAGQALDPDQVAADARRIFDLNFPPEGYMGAVVGAGDLNVRFDEATGRVEITAATSMPTTFMRLATIDTLDLNARALVVRQQTGLELALVLDVSGSMCEPNASAYIPCTSRPKIAALKQAANDLLDIVYGPNDIGEDLYVSVVPFNSRVKIGTSRSGWLTGAAPAGWKGCVELRSGALAYNDAPPSSGKWSATPTSVTYKSGGKNVTYQIPCNTEVLPLTASKATVKARINALVADGGTRIDNAAGWGWRTLSDRWTGLWGSAGLPLDDDQPTAKAVVIMSDGFNEPFAPIDGSTTTAQADQNLLNTCQAMRDAGYVVYTVAFQAPAAGQEVLRNCAASESNYFASASAADLQRAFRQIAGRLSALRLAE